MDSKEEYVTTLINGLETMLSTGNHADVTIVVDGKVFPCHKVKALTFSREVNDNSLYPLIYVQGFMGNIQSWLKMADK